MPPQKDGVIRLKRFVKGCENSRRVILRCADSPDYLSLSQSELAVVEPMMGKQIPIEQYLSWHLGGTHGILFNEAISLLMRLKAAHFLEDTSPDAFLAKLSEFTARAHRPWYTRTQGFGQALEHLSDLPLLRFGNFAPLAKTFRLLGRGLASYFSIGLLLAVLIFLVEPFGANLALAREALQVGLGNPEKLALEALLGLSLGASFLSVLRLFLLGGLGADFIPASLRLSGLCLPRFSVQDEDAFLAERPRFLRYHLFCLIAPWALAAACLHLKGSGNLSPEAALAALLFAGLGTVQLCPLFRGPLVRLTEGWLAALNVLDAGNVYLRRGLFKSLLGGKTPARRRDADLAFETATLGFACLSMIWLYLGSLLFANALLELVPRLGALARVSPSPVRVAAAALILGALLLGLVLFAVRLLLIPLRNVAAVAAVPLRRARRNLDGSHEAQNGSREVLQHFLQESPIFGHLSPAQVKDLAGHLVPLHYLRGQTVIEEGEAADGFFLLISGEAQVIHAHPDGSEEVVNVLRPGDGFGEVALIENVRRTATVRCADDSRLYLLARKDFDRLFPEGSEVRAKLTTTLRQSKVIMESQALSHLTSRQMRDLLVGAQTQTFQPREKIVAEGERGDAVFLLLEGKARVAHGPDTVARLGPGDLIGIISLLKGVPRTADVIAEAPARCLKISKALFLELCLSNPVVALLVSDLTEKQTSELKKAAGF